MFHNYLDICITLFPHRFFVKQDDFNFDIVNFPFLNSNILTNLAYMLTSRLIDKSFDILDCVTN